METATREKLEVKVDVQPRGTTSAICSAPFDQALEALAERGYRPISLEENARLRIQEGSQSYISRNGNWTREGFLYVPKEGAFLTPYSPVLENPEEATEANRNGKDFYPSDGAVQKALVGSVKIPYNKIKVPTKSFGSDDLTAHAFGDQAKHYGEFLRDAGVNEMPVWLVLRDYVNSQERAFVRQLFFCDVVRRSDLDGYNRGPLHDGRGLCYDLRLRGVSGGAEGTMPKN